MGKVIGKTYEVEQMEAQSDETKKASLTQEKSMAGNTASDVAFGLPGRKDAEKDIQGREDALTTLKKELEYKPSDLSLWDKIIKTGTTGMKGLSLVDERLQGAIAGPFYELQDPARKDIVQDTALAIIDGISGRRKVRFQDLVTARLPEIPIGGVDIRKPVAIIAGLGSELAVGSGVVRAARGVLQGGKQTLNSIQKSYDLAQEIKKASGKSIETLFDSKVGQIKVPAQVTQVLDQLPEGIMRHIFSKPKVYRVVEQVLTRNKEKVVGFSGKVVETVTEKLGVPELDAKNIWKVRQSLDDMLSSKDFLKATNKAKQVIKKVSNELRVVLSNVDKEVAPLMDQYSKYSDSIENASRILTTGGRVVVNKAASALKRMGEPGSQAALEEFASLFPRGAKMLKDIKVLNKNRAVVTAQILGVKAAVGAAIFSKFIRKPIREVIGADDGGGSGGGGGG